MKNLNWVYEDGDYILEASFGTAIISETEVTGSEKKYHFVGKKYKYGASFEASSGDLTKSEKDFSNFGDAEVWLIYLALMDFDQPQSEKATNLKKLSKTLEYCQELLPNDTHNSHTERLGLITRMLHGETFFDSVLEAPSNLNYPLDWHEGNGIQSAETPFGTACITKKRQDKRWHHGDVIQYSRPRIVHESGAETKIVWRSFPNFAAAEEWIFGKIYELENPTGAVFDIDNLIFTLDICTALLPENDDLIHYMRLKWIIDRMHEFLG